MEFDSAERRFDKLACTSTVDHKDAIRKPTVVSRLIVRRIMSAAAGVLASVWIAADDLPALEIGFSDYADQAALFSEWRPLHFKNVARPTLYELVADPAGSGVPVVRARADNPASGLISRFRPTPPQPVMLEWRWYVESVVSGSEVGLKAGDDFAARVYVSFDPGSDLSLWERVKYRLLRGIYGAPLPGRALSYVWTVREPVETSKPSPYTSRVQMIVAQSGDLKAGNWIFERRNVSADYQAAFGEAAPPINGIAIMTDTDNTGQMSVAYYADVRISSVYD